MDVMKAVGRELNHIRFYFTMIEKLKKALDNEQMGRLFFAVADYAMSGKKHAVEGDIIFPYAECCAMVDRFKAGF